MKNTVHSGVVIIEGHVQGLSNTRSLGQAGIPVVVLDVSNSVAKYSRYCQKFYKCPEFDSDGLAEFLITLALDNGWKDWLLLPSNDHAVVTLSRNKEKLEKYYKVITPGIDVIENIYDKAKLLKVALKANVSIPATFYASNLDLENFTLDFPVLTKGRFGLDFYQAVGRKAFLAHDCDELRDQLSRIERNFALTKTMTQELIPDDGTANTISFCAFCEDGTIKTYWMGAKLREHPIRFGTATFAKSVYIEECHTKSIPLLQALNYTGVCEVEYLKDPRDGNYKLIEINPRTWLWIELARSCGVDFAMIVYDYVNGRNKGKQYPKSYKTGACWVNPWTDIPYSLAAIFDGKLKLIEYINSFRKNSLVSLCSRQDPYPFLVYFFLSIFYLKKR